jgi:hypothetical protein
MSINGSVPPSVPRLVTATSPTTLPNSLVDELILGGEKRLTIPGSGTARSGITEYSDDFEALRPQDLSGGGSRLSVDTLNPDEVSCLAMFLVKGTDFSDYQKLRLLDAKLQRKKADEDALMMKVC